MKPKILIVDDDERFLSSLRILLETLEYPVQSATNATDALAVIKQEQFDLVITDKNMPHLTGFGVAKAIHAICDDIPIILCTGFDEREDSKKARQMGITEIVVKPVTMASLGTAVRKALDRRTAP